MTSIAIFHSISSKNLPSGELLVAENEKKMLIEKGLNVEFFKFSKKKSPFSSFTRSLQNASDNFWSRDAYKYVTDSIKSFNPDIVHFHGVFPHLSISAIQAAHDSGKKVVQTLHNGRWVCLEGGFYRNGIFCNKCVTKGPLSGVFHGCNKGIIASSAIYAGTSNALSSRKLFKFVDKFIAVSEFIKEQHVQAGFPPEKIIVKNNCVDTKQFKSFNKTGDRSGIAFVSRIDKPKGTEELKFLFDNLSETFHIVGDGPELLNLKTYCNKQGHTHVKFLGKLSQDKCFEIMSKVICTLIPSQCGEAFSLVASESMALGTPVIASNIGGLGPLVKKSQGGLIVNYRHPQEFLIAIEKLIKNPSLAKKMGEIGKKYVFNFLNLDINGEELLSIYNSLLNENSES